MSRAIDADRLLDALNSIVLDYTSEGKYPDGFGIDDAINLVEGAPTLTPPNEPLPLEQLREMDVEKVWRGEWVGVPSMGVYDTVCSKCGYCPGIRFWSSDFCPHCGAPMTDEAVEMVMERMEALHENT